MECYDDEKTNEEYRKELAEIFENIEDNDVLKFFYIYCKERIKGMLD